METISQRQLRNHGCDILRRAAVGETFRIRAGDTTVDLHRTYPTVVEGLAASGRLSAASTDDLTNFPEPGEGVEQLADTLDAIRGDR